MALAWAVWLLLSGGFWLLAGGPGGTGHPWGGDTPRGDDILSINGALEAPNSNFLLEGDIVRPAPGRAWAGASARWPKRRGLVQIPYELSPRYDQGSVRLLREAFADFARLTCVRFVPHSYQRDFVSIAPMAGCFSSVGRAGGRQPLSLAPACLRRGKGVALHELMHVAGFWHEHSRADRDGHVRIAWEHVLPGFEGNFLKSRTPNMLVGYDYSSVLHYSRYAFSRSGAPTITPLRPPGAVLGQRRRLSPSDVARVNRLYGCRGLGAPGSAVPGTPRVPPALGTPGSVTALDHPGASQPTWGTSGSASASRPIQGTPSSATASRPALGTPRVPPALETSGSVTALDHPGASQPTWGTFGSVTTLDHPGASRPIQATPGSAPASRPAPGTPHVPPALGTPGTHVLPVPATPSSVTSSGHPSTSRPTLVSPSSVTTSDHPGASCPTPGTSRGGPGGCSAVAPRTGTQSPSR